MRGDFKCDDCGLALGNVLLPVRHRCPAKIQIALPATPSRYITSADLTRDTLALAQRLTGISTIIGVARSGLVPASLLAAHLGCDLWSLDHRTGDLFSLGHGLRHRSPNGDGVLLVDDSCWSGTALANAKRHLEGTWAEKCQTLAVYVRPQAEGLVDHWAVSLADHWFEWNLFNAPFLQSVAFDFDGVLCRDFLPEEDDDGERYLAAMEAMQPTHRRPRKPVKIVTARLEKYRRPTETWLARHGIAVEQLVMGPWSSKQEREASDLWAWKAQQAKQLGVTLFVESSPTGAKRIAELAGIHAIATDDGSTHAPPPPRKLDTSLCIHRGEILERIVCRGCGGAKEVDVYQCGIHGRCHTVPANDHRAGMSCTACAMADEGFEGS